MQNFRGLIFDKDGTLFDFSATWDVWTGRILRKLAGGDPHRLNVVAHALDYDLDAKRLLPSSIVVAHTVDEVADVLLPLLPNLTRHELIATLKADAKNVPQVEAVPLKPLLAQLKAMGQVMGIATNDAEAPTEVHLSRAGVRDDFVFVAGSDSGYGGKPAPGQLLAFAAQTGLPPGEIAMIGDSLHDIAAARAAGMVAIAVCTGLATAETLSPHADVVLPDIGHLPEWLTQPV